MQNDGDLLVDRKRLKNRLTIWRAVAILLLVGIALLYTSRFESEAGMPVGRDYIAMVRIEGVMGDDKDREKVLKSILDDDRAKALLVWLDSPGGTAVGGEELYLQLKKISAKKPVIGVMRTLCASACYMAAMGTDHIIAREGTLTGSIGVMMQAAEFSRLADKLGITPITIKSGRYKDAPSLTEPFADDQRKVVESVVMDAYDHFVRIIMAGRKMDEARVRELADGRIYTGSQAAELNLIDGLGGEDEAIAWLVKDKKLSASLKVREIKAEPEIDSLFKKLGSSLGLNIFDKSMVGLDGLVSIWHPSLM